MKVRDLMSQHVRTCRVNADLSEVAMQMWTGDCGIVPILEEDGRLAGVLTDRDICMAVATKHRPAGGILAKELIGSDTHFCARDDDIQDALRLMAHRKVRRLPVVNEAGKVEGILSVNDVILASAPSQGKKGDALTYAEAMETLRSISAHRFAMVQGHLEPVIAP
jgi:CBS domain-containing protein